MGRKPLELIGRRLECLCRIKYLKGIFDDCVRRPPLFLSYGPGPSPDAEFVFRFPTAGRVWGGVGMGRGSWKFTQLIFRIEARVVLD